MSDLTMSGPTTGADDGNSEWLDEHLELYAIAALPAHENARVERGLAALAPETRREYEGRLTEVRTAMARYAAARPLDPPAELRRRVLADFDAAFPKSERTARAGGDSSTRRRFVAAAATVAAAALGAGVLIGRATAPEPEDTTALDESRRAVADVLNAPDAEVTVAPLADDRGSIAVVVSRSADRAVTIVQGAEQALSPDLAYQLWLVGGADAPISAGLVPGDDADPVVVDRIGAATVLAVTIEPAGGSAQPTTPILAQVSL